MNGPRIAVLMPVYRAPRKYLRLAILSVMQQSIRDWELVIVDDASQDAEVAEVLEWSARDPRVQVINLVENQGISGASNAGLELVTAPWLALLDHDDALEPDALREVLAAAAECPEADIIYTDRDAVDEAGIPTEVFHKPDWSPERLRANMYVAHLTVLRTEAVLEVGGFRPEFDGAQDHDLVLRVSERGNPVAHVPKVLYHWRQLLGSTARSAEAKPHAAEAGRSAVAAHLTRIGRPARVLHTAHAGTFTSERVPRPQLVSIVIPTRGGRASVRGKDRILVVEAVRSIVGHDYLVDFEIVVVHDTVADPGYLEQLRTLAGQRLRVVDFDQPFNFSAKINSGVEAARGEVVVLLNDDVEVITGSWLDQLAALADEPDVGAVGAKLLFENGRVQHAGHFFGDGQVGHIAMGLRDGPGPFAANLIDREVVGVTAACLAQRRSVWVEVGGMDESLPNNFNDVDYCHRIRQVGYRIVQANSVRLYHYESQTRHAVVAAWEAQRIIGRLGEQLNHDPYTPDPKQSRTVREWIRVSRAVLADEGVRSFTQKARKRLLPGA